MLATGLLTAGIVAGLAGPSAYAVATAATPHTQTGAASAIRAWVQANFTPTTVGGTTVYKLTG